MNLFSRAPQPDDWVVTTAPIKTSLSDYVTKDAGIRPGTRGVVLGRSGWRSLTVRLDGGLLGTVTVRAHSSQVRVTRRAAGVEAFASRTGRLNAARFGVAALLVGPPLLFAVSWLLHGGSKAGLLVALTESVIYGTLDLLSYALSSPVHALIYVALLTTAMRFAFR